MVIISMLLLVPATLAALYYFTLTTLFLTRKRAPVAETNVKFAILVPAHNEALTLPATLESLKSQDYPEELRPIFVIADNCTDSTAAVANRHGAVVVERHHHTLRGKGYALEQGLAEILPGRPDAVLIFDADGELDWSALRVFAARLRHNPVVQGSIRTRNASDGPSAAVAAVGNILDDAIAAGRDSLGLRVRLRGSNMAFRREVLEKVPWRCHGLTEDAEYSEALRRAGIGVCFEPAARARSESPATLEDLARQRRRWNAAFRWIDSKPLVLAQLLFTTLVVLASESWFLISWLTALWFMTGFVYLWALKQAGLRLNSPMLLTTARLVLLVFARRASAWQRTRRVAETAR